MRFPARSERDAGEKENGDMSDVPLSENYRFFNHSACEFYPCHDMPADDLNCLFWRTAT